MGFIGVIILILTIVMVASSLKMQNDIVNYEELYKKRASKVNRIKNNIKKVKRQVLNSTKEQTDIDVSAFKNLENGRFKGEDLKALGQQYPTLRGSFLEHATMLESLENTLIDAQDSLNDLITEYNTYIKTFPNSIFANILGFVPEKVIGEKQLNRALDFKLDESKDVFD